MTLSRIALVDDARDVWISVGQRRRPGEPGEALSYAKLAEQLGSHTPATVEIRDRLSEDLAAPGTALIMATWMLPELLGRPDAPELASRVLLAAVTDLPATYVELEGNRLAGAVAAKDWLFWQEAASTEPAGPSAGPERAAAVIGRRDVAAVMGVEVSSAGRFSSEHYGPIFSFGRPELPAILAAYLEACLATPRLS